MEVIKRNGQKVIFNPQKIIKAVENAMRETIEGIDSKIGEYIAEQVEEILTGHKNITVEDIQDLVEVLLMESPRKDVAKRYILYRSERNKTRHLRKKQYSLLTEEFISPYKHKEPPMNQLGMFTYYRTYSRWLNQEQRREYWWETARRAIEYNCSLAPTTREEAEQLYDNVFHLRQFVSGRSFWVGGTGVTERYSLANFNCAFTVIDGIEAFRDLFFLLMLGSGVGFRILKEDAAQLPKFKNNLTIIHQDYIPLNKDKRLDFTSLNFLSNDTVEIIIGDSKEGWVDSLYHILNIASNKIYDKIDKVIINYNHVRPKGEKLKTFGGTSSGHESLKTMLYKVNKILYKARNGESYYSKLEPIDIIDICNAVGENVVIGGVRRTSQVAIISPTDVDSIQAKNNLYIKHGNSWIEDKELSHRKMSNNSIFYEKKPTREQLHWHIEQLRYSGEPGFINAETAKDRYEDFQGCNPCCEILLPSKGVCNLVTLNVHQFINNNKLDIERLKKAQRLNVRAAYRMSLVELELHQWNIVNQKDKLIGSSLTGWQDMVDAVDMSQQEQEQLLLELWEISFDAAEEVSQELNNKQPILITTIKPEGTLSLLPGVSPGLHYSHSPYYIRRIRINANDPLCKVCEELKYPVFPETDQDWDTCSTKVIEFPVQSTAKHTKYDISAIQQLENYKMFMEYYVDHNASITVTVKDEEWEEIEEWVWNNWDCIVAISFISLSKSFYDLMPYESITKEEYEERSRKMRPFIPSLISKYEVQETELDIGSMSDCDGGTCSIR